MFFWWLSDTLPAKQTFKVFSEIRSQKCFNFFECDIASFILFLLPRFNFGVFIPFHPLNDFLLRVLSNIFIRSALVSYFVSVIFHEECNGIVNGLCADVPCLFYILFAAIVPQKRKNLFNSCS